LYLIFLIAGNDLETRCAALNCSYNCKQSTQNSDVTCFCKSGYTLGNDGKTCVGTCRVTIWFATLW